MYVSVSKGQTPEIILKYSSPQRTAILRSKTSLVISKKVAQKAVDRNRIKRIIREAKRKIDAPGSYSIIVKKNISGLKTDQVQEILAKLTKK